MIIGGIYLEIYYKIYFSLIYYKIYSSFDIIIITINIAFTFLICLYPIHFAKKPIEVIFAVLATWRTITL